MLSIGELVGEHFEVLHMLGRGGMAQVFEAKDRVLERRVALKVARPYADFGSLRQEAKALARFRHPSLCIVHGFGEHRGLEYIVLERVFGVSLAAQAKGRRAEGRPFRVDEVLDLLAALADGLSVVHRAGLAHRDVKPGNVMLAADGRVVLMDFGLVLPEVQIADTRFFAGSPPYMPPEALASAVEVGEGHLVDIFALGVVAFELLTGQRPWEARTLEDLVVAHGRGDRASVSALRPDTPAALVELIHEMLSPSAKDRPPSTEGVAWQLRKLKHRFERETAGSAPPSPALAPLDVLVVEDNDAIARVIEFYAHEALSGHIAVRRARDGEQALALFRERAPDLLLLDIHMPRMNGVEVAMHLRGERAASSCRIVGVSAGAQPEDVELLSQLGVHHYLTKDGSLRARLAELVRRLFPLHAGPARRSLLPPG